MYCYSFMNQKEVLSLVKLSSVLKEIVLVLCIINCIIICIVVNYYSQMIKMYTRSYKYCLFYYK